MTLRLTRCAEELRRGATPSEAAQRLSLAPGVVRAIARRAGPDPASPGARPDEE
jgi:hypothetical protein